MTRGRILLAVGMLLASAQPLAAQSEDAQGRLVYAAQFFTQFSPANALQVIQRVPGFSLDGGDSQVRGFGQAAGNVVINGQRPSSKSDSLESVLSRIPASRVLRVELSSGNAFGADYAGKPQVVNLVLNDDGGLAGTVEARLTRQWTGRLLPKANASVIYRKGDSSFSAAVTYQLYSGTEEGTDRIVDLATGDEIEFRDKFSRNTEPFATVSLGWGLEEAPDRSVHINAKASPDKWTINQPSDVFVDGVQVRHDLYTEDHLWRSYELSGDVTRPLAGGAIKLNALATHRHRRNDDEFLQDADGDLLGGFYQKFDDYRDERVARLTWSRSGLAGWTVEIGAEGAFNRLETDLNLFDIDAMGDRTVIDLPIDDAVVSEYRAETFINAGRDVASNVHLDLGLTYEASRLKVTGDVSAKRTLKFLKPKASIDWTPGDLHAQLSVRRTVAQLDFSDFVSSASFTTNQVSSGNADLLPQRAWEMLLSADHKLLGDGRIKVELGYNAIAMVQDRVPTGNGLDAPGNLGNGTEWIARTNIDLPLGRVGIKGGRLSLYGSYVDTSVEDPYTLRDRPFTGNSRFAYTVAFRQDLGEFAWGLELGGNTGSTYFRSTETDNLRGISPKVSVFAEYRPTARSTVTLGAENITDSVSRRLRTFYDPDRTAPEPFLQEYRVRNGHALIYLSVKHSFG